MNDYKNKKWLEEQYIINEKSTTELGVLFNINAETIRYWLKKHNIKRRNHLTNGQKEHLSNIMKGDNNPFYGKKHTEKTKQKISEARIGKYFGKNNSFYGKKHTNKTKVIISEKNKGRLKGIKRSDDIRKKISESKKGYVVSEETKKKLSKSHLGKKLSEEHRKKLRIVTSGKNNPFYGKHHTEETKKKLRDLNLGKEVSIETRRKISEAISGAKHYNWNPNREEVYAPYGANFYDDELRNEKWDLQGGRDLLTGAKLEYGKSSHYHHIDYNKANDDPDNHCWLTINNHARITGFQTNPIKKEHFKKVLEKNTLLLKEGKIPSNWSSKNKALFKQEQLEQLKLDNYIKVTA